MNKVLLIDDHPVVRFHLKVLIDAEPDLEVCGEVGSLQDGLKAIDSLVPDLTVVDISLAGGSGLELIQRVQADSPEIKYIVFSAHDESVFAQRAIDVGAVGYVNKREEPGRVIDAIHSVIKGELYFKKSVLPEKQSSDDEGLANLSNREIEVLELIGHGMGNTSIANRLKLSVKTIESHRENIKKKMGLGSASELSRYAMHWLLGNG